MAERCNGAATACGRAWRCRARLPVAVATLMIVVVAPVGSGRASGAGTTPVTLTLGVADQPAGSVGASLSVDPAEPPYDASPSGEIEVFEGTTSYGTFPAYRKTSLGPNATIGPFPAGTHTLTARYGGDATYGPATATATFTVSLRTPDDVSMSATEGFGGYSCAPGSSEPCTNRDVPEGTPITLFAHVAACGSVPAPPPGRPPSTFTFFDNGQPLTTAPADNGDASAVVTLPAGNHGLAVRYNGDPYFAPTFGPNAWSIRVAGATSGTTPVPAGGGDPVVRYAGADRVATSVAISRASFTDGAATAAVLTSSDGFADALTGAALAVARGAPLLVTPSRSTLDERVAAELRRALPVGRSVFVLGGERAMPAGIVDQVRAAGYVVVR